MKILIECDDRRALLTEGEAEVIGRQVAASFNRRLDSDWRGFEDVRGDRPGGDVD